MGNPFVALHIWPLLPLVLLPGISIAAEAAPSAGASAVEQCENCHAVDAGNHSSAPLLNGLPRRYLEEQLINFREGKRGDDTNDVDIRTMITQVRQLPAEDLKSLARHYAREKKAFSPESVSGNPGAGEFLFDEHCSGCHASSMGRFFTKSPPIAQLRGSYILNQLKAFAAGNRGFASENKHKLKMVEVSRQFDEQQLLDITAYIKSVKDAGPS